MKKKHNKKILLIVEDEEILVKILSEKLISEGFQIICAKDGNEGLKIALEKHPDLILLDLLMPNCDGITMLKELRNDAWGSRASVIVLTNVATQGKIMGIEKDSSSDMFTFLVKTDWSLDNLLVKIKERLKI